jgi:ABC-type glutathione transport system ATPase component
MLARRRRRVPDMAMHRLSSVLQVAERASFMEEVKLAKEKQQRVCFLSKNCRYISILMQEFVT